MSKSKRSHHRSEEKLDESDEHRNIESDISVDQKKSKKKSSKKSKKHRLKRKASPSESDSESSSSSSSESSSSSSEEEIKRKKQKKHKKSKRRNRHENDEKPAKLSRAEHSDEEEDVKVLNEPSKVHYVSSGEEERHRKANRRIDDRKRFRESASNERMELKSKWDSPNDDFDRKRPRDFQPDRRNDERGRNERRPFPDRERFDNHHRDRDNRQSPQRERFDRNRNDRRPDAPNYRDRHEGPPQYRRQPDSEWRPRDRRPDNADRFRRPEPDRRRRSNSPRNGSNRNRYGEDKRDDGRRPNFDRNMHSNERNRPFRRENDSRDRNRIQSNEHDRPFRRDEPPPRDRIRDERPPRFDKDRRDRSPMGRDRSPPPIHDRSPIRENPFRRKPSDFRHEEERPDRNDGRNQNRPNGGNGRRKKFSDDENHEWGKPGEKKTKTDPDEEQQVQIEKEKPNFGLSGKLTEETNTVNGVVIKYSEPPEARRPKRRWRLYPFKGAEELPTLHIHRQSCYLIGRDKKVCELTVDHPSCSKQHAALQYRLVPYERSDGTIGKRVRPYIIDLESANGTFLNNKPIEPKKYYELFEKDMLKFGFSSREYVLLAEDSDVGDPERMDEEYEVPIKEEK